MSFQYWWTVEAFKREYGKIVEWKRGVSPYSAKHEECFVKVVLADDYDALRARVEELEKDAERLRFIATSGNETSPRPYFCDGIGDFDFHEEAAIYASAFGRDAPNGDDYLASLRTAIDAALAQQEEEG